MLALPHRVAVRKVESIHCFHFWLVDQDSCLVCDQILMVVGVQRWSQLNGIDFVVIAQLGDITGDSDGLVVVQSRMQH
jgi:hypothetical protein